MEANKKDAAIRRTPISLVGLMVAGIGMLFQIMDFQIRISGLVFIFGITIFIIATIFRKLDEPLWPAPQRHDLQKIGAAIFIFIGGIGYWLAVKNIFSGDRINIFSIGTLTTIWVPIIELRKSLVREKLRQSGLSLNPDGTPGEEGRAGEGVQSP